jgi:hypothetical protein
MLRLKLVVIVLAASFVVIHVEPSEALGRELLDQRMTCDQDPYERQSKECILAIYPEDRSDDVIAQITCRHRSEVEAYSCRYWWTSSPLEYSCSSSSGEITWLKPLDIRANPQRVCNALCKG